MMHIQHTRVLLFLLLLLMACSSLTLAQRKQRKVIEEETPKHKGNTLNTDKKQLPQNTWERRFRQAISYYENEQYAEADSLLLACAQTANDEQKPLVLFWRAKTLMQQARYAEALSLHIALESQLPKALRLELLFDKAVLAACQHNFLEATQQLIALLPVDWATTSQGDVLLSKAYRYLTLLVYAYLTEQEIRALLPTIQNRTVQVLFALQAAGRQIYRGHYDAALAELTEFCNRHPTLDTDTQRRITDLKFQAMQLKSRMAKRLRVGVLLPATLHPFNGSSDIGASTLMLGVILAADEANHLSQRAFVHLAVRSTSGLRPEGILAQAQWLVENDSVQVILGPMYSEEAVIVSAYCGAHGVVMVTPTATDERISQVSPTSFQLNPTHRARGASIARFAIEELKAKTAGVFVQDSTYSKEMGLGFKEAFESLGGEVKLFALLPESFSSISKALAPLNLTFDEELGYPLTQFDVIYLPMTSPEAVAIALSQLRFYNIRGELLGSSDWLDERLLNNRELLTTFYYASDFQLAESPATDGVIALYKTRFGEHPDAFFWLGYDAMDYLCRVGLLTHSNIGLEGVLRNAPLINTHHIPIFFDGKNVNQMMNIIRFSNGTIARVK